MNKKAIITYFVLLLFIIIMYFYIQNTLSKLSVTTTTQQSNTTASNLTAIKGNSSYLIATTTVNTGYYTTVSCSSSETLLIPGNCQENTSQTNVTFSKCTPFGGFTCSNLFLSSTTGNLTFTFSETQYANWASVEIFLLNQTTAPSPKKRIVNLTDSVNLINISNSEQVTVTVPAIKPKLPSGVEISGNIWALFRLKGSNTTYISEIAKFYSQSI